MHCNKATDHGSSRFGQAHPVDQKRRKRCGKTADRQYGVLEREGETET